MTEREPIVQTNTEKLTPDPETKKEEKKKEEKKEENDKKAPVQQQAVSLGKMLSLASGREKAIMAFGIIAGLASACSFPLFAIIFGDMMDSFDPSGDISKAVNQTCLWMVYLSIGMFCIIFIQNTCFSSFGNIIGFKYRKKYLEAVLSQDVTYFDLNKPQEIPTMINSECANIQDALGEKFGELIVTFGGFASGLVVAFYYGWQLSLVLLAVAPILVLGSFLLMKTIQTMYVETSKNYAKAGGLAEQAISSMKIVHAYGETQREHSKFTEILKSIWTITVKSSVKSSVNLAVFRFSLMAVYSAGFYFGSLFIQRHYYIHSHIKNGGYYSRGID